MKKYINYIGLLTLIIFFTNCDDKSSTQSTVHPLVGVWEWTSTTMTDGVTTITENPTTGNTETVIMNEDGTSSFTFTSNGGTSTGSGTWSTNSNKLTWIVTYPGESSSITMILDYSVSGNVFIGSLVSFIEGTEVTSTYTYTKS